MAAATTEPATCFTESEVKDFREAFLAYDRFDIGQVRIKELRNVLRACGHNVTDNELLQISNQFYTMGKKTIDFDDFMQLMEQGWHRSNHPIEDLREAFSMFDTDGSGRFNADKVQHVLESIRVTEGLDQRDIEQFLGDVDFNRDGNIDYEEILRIMKA